MKKSYIKFTNEDILKYKNYLKWDKENFKFQKEHKTILPNKYDLYSQGDFFEFKEIDFLKKEVITQGLLISKIFHIKNEIDYLFFKELDKKYPSLIINHFDSNQKEKCLNGCKKRNKAIKYYGKNYLKIIKLIRKETKYLDKYTFRKNSKKSYDTNYFIIGGKSVAKKIIFKNFSETFEENQLSYKHIEQEIKKIFKFLKRKKLIKF